MDHDASLMSTRHVSGSESNVAVVGVGGALGCGWVVRACGEG